MAKFEVSNTIDESILRSQDNTNEDIKELGAVIAQLKVGQSITLMPETVDGKPESMRLLKVRASRAGAIAKKPIKYAETNTGGVLVWLRDQGQTKDNTESVEVTNEVTDKNDNVEVTDKEKAKA